MAENLVGVLAETLVERLELVTQRSVERLVGVDEGEQDRACRRMRGDCQRLDRQRANPRQDRLARGDVRGEALAQFGAGSVVAKVLENVADPVALPASDEVLLDVEATKRALQVGRVDFDQTAIGALAEDLTEQVEQIEPRGRHGLGRAVRQLGPDHLWPQLALVECVELGHEVVDNRGDVLGPVLVDQGLGGDLGHLLRRRPLASVGLGLLDPRPDELIGGVERDRRTAATIDSGSVELTERLLEALANTVVGFGLEHFGDTAAVLRVEHLEPTRQFAVALKAALHRGLVRVVEELGIRQEPEMTDLTARGVEEVVPRLASERGVVVDQRRQADGVVGIELPPPAGLNFALARLLAQRAADEDRLQLAGGDRAEILQRGELGLVAVGNDDD